MNTKSTTFSILSILILCCFFYSCGEEKSGSTTAKSKASSKQIFSILESPDTGIDFRNDITENEQKNYFNFEYIYNGGGVAIGDINNDGLPDIYFSANENENKLYLNKGDMKFEDITAKSGVAAANGWKTGVNMFDANNDGWLDIYVCRSGWKNINPVLRENLLFINKKDGTFVEAAKLFGLNDGGFSITSSFFDYDNDGDLDLYVTNHPYLFNLELKERLAKRENPDAAARDRLYRNEGNNTFTEVSKEAGIFNYGHGLGLVTADVNHDGNIDIYVANDYKETDFFYINQGNGTFKESVKDYTGHISFYAMGVDIADINNDGLEDIFTTEMLPFDYKRSKTNMASMNVKLFEGMKALGLHYQYMHNSLQLNTGQDYFSEISQLAGISKTDWSWSCILEDFDNDGYRDLFIANGYKRDVFDKDYKKDADKKAKSNKNQLSLEEVYDLMPATKLKNFVYKNNGDLSFSDMSAQWGLTNKSLTQGAAFADLDLDGDIDIVTSNLDDPAFIMENNTNGANNYINIKLKGKGYNTAGLNAKLRIYYDNGKMQHHEMKNARGFQSSSEPLMHFGLGNAAELDSVVVYWHTGNTTVLRGIKANQTLEIEEDRSMAKRSLATLSKNVLKAAEGAIQPRFRHQEKPYNDYQKQVLLPHKFSQQGPFLSKADVNGDDLEDFYVSGAAGQGGALYLQQSDGSFKKKTQSIFEKHKAYEDMQSLFVDVDGDLDMDLYVVSGSSEFAPKSNLFQDRLYINDGKGNMKHDVDALPPIQSSGTAVTSTDLDGDGDQDIFVGGGIFPDHYPYSSASFLLMNEGGKFVNIAQAAGVDLIGMVSDAEFTDYNGDGYDDLMVVGEWMNITFFRNDKGKGFTNVTEELGLGKTNGFWNTIEPIDIDADGDLDYLVGNVGLNYKFTASAERPFSIYSGDFDSNGTYDVFLAKIDGGKEVPIRGRECTSEQMPIISDRFKTYNAFADADMSQIIGNKTQGSIKYQAFQFASVMIKNEGNRFTVSELPRTAQISSVNAIAQIDLDGDQTKEIVLAGNKYQTEAETSRLDASIGMILEYDSDGSWKAYEPSKYGYELGGDVKDMAVFEQDGKARLIKASNDEILTIYDIVKSN